MEEDIYAFADAGFEYVCDFEEHKSSEHENTESHNALMNSL